MPKASEILEHFISRCDWVNTSDTVDRIIVGDPEGEHNSCVVTWMPSFSSLREMAGRRHRLMICHEPLFWDHTDSGFESDPRAADKLAFIREHDLTVIRLHDCWDRWPEIGIPDAWAKFLGYKQKPAAVSENRFQFRFDYHEPISLRELAFSIAQSTRVLGQSQVEVAGDDYAMVEKVGIGTGCATSIATYEKLGCDCCVLCDDGTSHWRDTQYAIDRGLPVIIVNHGTSEEPGMVTLTNYINSDIDGMIAEHLPQGCIFRLLGES
jgi:putative NIF3 family GTP cyclohydrolase 1 type 2